MPFYDLTSNGQRHPRLMKRGVILRVVQAVIGAGAAPEQVSPCFEHGMRQWFSMEGNLSAKQLRQRLPAQRQGPNFLSDNEIFHVRGRTYALSNQWGDPSWSESISLLVDKWPALGIRIVSLDQPNVGDQFPAEETADVEPGAAAAGGGPVFPDNSHQLLGMAGEYYVLFQLHRRGLLAGLAPRGHKEVDVIALGPEQKVAVAIQAKTRRSGNNGGWRLAQKHEQVPFPGLHFCFVDLESSRPVTYVIPAEIVAAAVTSSHAVWLRQPGHNGHDMRTITVDWGFPVPGYDRTWLSVYREAWHLVCGPAASR